VQPDDSYFAVLAGKDEGTNVLNVLLSSKNETAADSQISISFTNIGEDSLSSSLSSWSSGSSWKYTASIVDATRTDKALVQGGTLKTAADGSLDVPAFEMPPMAVVLIQLTKMEE
jgi:hypothetical protein